MEESREKLEESRQHKTTKRKPGKLLLCAAVFLAAIGAGAFFFYRFLFRVVPAFSSATYELGDRVSRRIEDYLIGSEWSVSQGELDISQVDINRVGTYQALVYHGREEFLYEIVIEDTVAPDILVKQGPVCLAAGREYSPGELVEDVLDADSQIVLSVREGEVYLKSVCYDMPGSFDCVIAAEDSSGNRSSVTVPVIVDKAPEITGVQNIYLVLGSQVDYLDQVTAWDESDGDLTGQITVDDGDVRLAEEGTYTVIYRVEDGLGIDSVSYADVTVATAEDLQEMIGSRQISRASDRIVGALNLYDSGASEYDNVQETLEYMRPAMVQLYYSSGRGYSSGSGYIMEITDDTIYICSNRHVVEAHDEWGVYFYDGTVAEGISLGCSNKFDVGVVTVRTDQLPERLLEQLMTVHIDRGYWNGLNDQRIDVGLERLDREGGVLHMTMGTLVKVKQNFRWYDQKDHTEVTVKLEHGDSGSAVLDGYGNLIGMAYAYSSSPRRNWCVPLDGILECYEEITGRSVYVYGE